MQSERRLVGAEKPESVLNDEAKIWDDLNWVTDGQFITKDLNKRVARVINDGNFVAHITERKYTEIAKMDRKIQRDIMKLKNQHLNETEYEKRLTEIIKKRNVPYSVHVSEDEAYKSLATAKELILNLADFPSKVSCA